MMPLTTPTRPRGSTLGALPSSRWTRGRSAAALSGVFVLAACAIGYHTAKVTEWLVMTDEMQYAKLAQAIGDDLSLVPRLHGAYYGSLSQLYPLLLAPIYRAFDVPTAFQAAHLLNAVLMASACFPAYLLTRAVTRDPLAALLVSALSVAIPWTALSITLLTDVAAYPAFLWAALGAHRALARPGFGSDLLAMAGIALAVAARTQFVVLAAVLSVAVIVHEVLYAWRGDGRRLDLALRTGFSRAVRGHPLGSVVVVAGLAAWAILGLNSSLGRVLGNYSGALSGFSLSTPGFALSAVHHLDFVLVGVGVLPFILALAFILEELRRPTGRSQHGFAVLLAGVTLALVLMVTSFVIRFGVPDRVYDRYLFYLAPLLFVGMAGYLTGRRRGAAWLALAALAFAALASFTPFTAPPVVIAPESPVSATHVVLDGRSQQLGQLAGIADLPPRTVIVAGAFLITTVLALLVRRFGQRTTLIAASLAVLAFNVAETGYVFRTMLGSQIGAAPGFQIPLHQRNWIDRTVPAGASVGLMPSTAFDEFTTARIWWEAEFWNRSADRAFSVDGAGGWTPWGYRLGIAADRRTGRIAATGQTDGAPRFVVIGPHELRFRPAGAKIAEIKGMRLLRAELPYRAEWTTLGVTADGWVSAGRPGRIRFFPDRRGRERVIRMRLTLDLPAYPARPPRYVIDAPGERRAGTLQALEQRAETIDVCVPPDRPVDVTVRGFGRVSLPGGGTPAVHLNGLDTEPLGRGCPGSPSKRG